MNLRIKLLADQALKEFMDKHEYATVIVPDSLSQKFAELIIKDCLDQITSGQDPAYYATEAVVRMRKHFGIP